MSSSNTLLLLSKLFISLNFQDLNRSDTLSDIILSSTIQTSLLNMHDNVYKKINQNYVDIFLCGGASNNNNYVRDDVKKHLEKNSNLRILYPEDLFIEMLYKDKQADLLSLEKFLADNCDIICIICESPGSLVELGAFTNHNTLNKVVAVIEKKRQKDKSFIMLGPIKLIKKNHTENIVFYSKDDLVDLTYKLKKLFKNPKNNLTMNKRPINSIIGLYYFIPIILYFFRSLETANLISYLKFLFKKQTYSISEFNTLFRSSIKLLYKDKFIQKNSINSITVYELTEQGYRNVFNVLNATHLKNNSKLYDSIRFGIMDDKYK